MLWSLLKIVLFVAAVVGLTFGAGYLTESDGGLVIMALGKEVSLGPLQSAIALCVLVGAVWLLFKVVSIFIAVLRWLNGDETALSRYFDRNRERRGFQALSEGVMAMASGDGKLAMSKISKANSLLDKPELTNLLTAQAAEMAGDRKKAEEVYKKLIQRPATRFVGIRGIMQQKLADGDTDTALKLAAKAFVLQPKHVETQDVLLKLQAQSEDWAAARTTLKAKLKHGSLPRDVHKRRDAVLALSEAMEADPSSAGPMALEANRLSPDLVPAAVMAAEHYIEIKKQRYAARVLSAAWASEPHPDLAAAYAAIAPDESPKARIKRFGALTKNNPDHRESTLLNAELLIAAEDFPAARRALGKLAEEHPDARSLSIMAAVERGEGADEAVVRAWLAKAVTAPRGPQWVCENCNFVQSTWVPVCKNCHSFDSLSWTEARQDALPSGTLSSTMLPLLAGASKTEQDDAVPAVVEEANLPIDAEIIAPDTQKHPETKPTSAAQ